MAAIRAEHENQTRTVQAQKTRLDMIISDLYELRTMGKPDVTTEISRAVSLSAPEISATESGDVEMLDARTREESES